MYPYLQLMYRCNQHKGEHTTCPEACMSLNNEEHLLTEEPHPHHLQYPEPLIGRQKTGPPLHLS